MIIEGYNMKKGPEGPYVLLVLMNLNLKYDSFFLEFSISLMAESSMLMSDCVQL
jgi:hypothetical protein